MIGNILTEISQNDIISKIMIHQYKGGEKTMREILNWLEETVMQLQNIKKVIKYLLFIPALYIGYQIKSLAFVIVGIVFVASRIKRNLEDDEYYENQYKNERDDERLR